MSWTWVPHRHQHVIAALQQPRVAPADPPAVAYYVPKKEKRKPLETTEQRARRLWGHLRRMP